MEPTHHPGTCRRAVIRATTPKRWTGSPRACRWEDAPMREPRLSSVSSHATRRLAQRNLSPSDVHYVYRYGRMHHTGKATFVHLGLRDIPDADRRDDRV